MDSSFPPCAFPRPCSSRVWNPSSTVCVEEEASSDFWRGGWSVIRRFGVHRCWCTTPAGSRSAALASPGVSARRSGFGFWHRKKCWGGRRRKDPRQARRSAPPVRVGRRGRGPRGPRVAPPLPSPLRRNRRRAVGRARGRAGLREGLVVLKERAWDERSGSPLGGTAARMAEHRGALDSAPLSSAAGVGNAVGRRSLPSASACGGGRAAAPPKNDAIAAAIAATLHHVAAAPQIRAAGRACATASAARRARLRCRYTACRAPSRRGCFARRICGQSRSCMSGCPSGCW